MLLYLTSVEVPLWYFLRFCIFGKSVLLYFGLLSYCKIFCYTQNAVSYNFDS